MSASALHQLVDFIADDPYGHPGWDTINAAEDELAAHEGRPSRAHTDDFCDCGACRTKHGGKSLAQRQAAEAFRALRKQERQP